MLKVRLNDKIIEELSLDRLAKTIDNAFKASHLPYTSYISQIIAKATIDELKKEHEEVTPELITTYTYNTLCDLGYEDIGSLYLEIYKKIKEKRI